MDETLQAQIEHYLSHLGGLIRRGHQVRDMLREVPTSKSAIVAARAWQENCGAAVHQLSGGSKAHWLARSLSQAFLMRSAAGQAVEGAELAEIIERLVDVLEQGVTSLTQMDASAALLHHPRHRLPAGSSLFTTRSSSPLSSKPTLIAGGPSSKTNTTWRYALPAESWRPL
jgi:hypothetical protein